MYIDKKYRGKGNLGIMIDHLKREAQLQGCLQLRLYVHEENRVAAKAYRKVGFQYSHYAIMSLETPQTEGTSAPSTTPSST